MFNHSDLLSLQQPYDLIESSRLLERDIEQLEKLAIKYTPCNQLGVPMLGGLICMLCDAVLDMHTIMVKIEKVNIDDLQELRDRLHETALDTLDKEILAAFTPTIRITAEKTINSINHNYQATKKELLMLINDKLARHKKMDC